MDELLRKDAIEGEEAFQRFDSLVSKVLAVSKDEVLRRAAEHKKRSALNPKKRGPKPKGVAVVPDAGVDAQA